MGPTQIKKKNKKRRKRSRRGRKRFNFYFYFFSLSLLYSIYRNRTVRIRRGKKQSALLDEGYAWEPKTRDFAEFLIKTSENPMFWFFSDLRLSAGHNWSKQKVKLIHASRATHVYQNFGVSSNFIRYEFSPK